MGGSDKKKRRAESESSSESSSSGSDSDYDDRKRKKHKKEKKSKKHKKEHKRKKHKKEHKSKKSKKSKSSHSSAAGSFGKYGIIGPQDRFAKQQEFYIWLRDHKNRDPETLPRYEVDELWADYMEDFNTATMPHKKYYNLEAWERKEAQKRLEKGKAAAAAPPTSTGMFSLLDDEKARRVASDTRASSSKLSQAELLEMRRVMRERAEQAVRKDLMMKTDEKAGVRTQSMMRGLMAPGQKAI